MHFRVQEHPHKTNIVEKIQISRQLLVLILLQLHFTCVKSKHLDLIITRQCGEERQTNSIRLSRRINCLAKKAPLLISMDSGSLSKRAPTLHPDIMQFSD